MGTRNLTMVVSYEEYYPVHLLKSYSLDDLPNDDEFQALDDELNKD